MGEKRRRGVVGLFDQVRAEFRAWSWVQYFMAAAVDSVVGGLLKVVDGRVNVPTEAWSLFLIGSTLLTVCAIATRRNASAWREEREQDKERADLLVAMKEWIPLADNLINNLPQPAHGEVARGRWMSAIEDAIRSASLHSRNTAIPGDVTGLIHNPMKRPKFKTQPDEYDFDMKKYYDLCLARNGMIECLAECRKRGLLS